ncbi:MAG: hypothetical protein AB7F59_00815 [Bdellovibrionales bacterium]
MRFLIYGMMLFASLNVSLAQAQQCKGVCTLQTFIIAGNGEFINLNLNQATVKQYKYRIDSAGKPADPREYEAVLMAAKDAARKLETNNICVFID